MKRRSKLFFRKFGFELEFSSPFSEIERLVKKIIPKIYGKNHIECNEYSIDPNKKYKKWELKIDGSTECELTTPISTINNFNKIEKLLKEFTLYNPKITKNDSVHIHMQANDIPKHNIIAAWIQIERTIMRCFPRHRRNNGYCQKLIHKRKFKKISDFFIKAEDESRDHHAIISLNYYQERKTVEFRIMEGNINIHNIKPWVKFCMLFLNYAKTIDPVEIICKKPKSKLKLEEMIKMMKIQDKEIIEFLKRRQKTFR